MQAAVAPPLLLLADEAPTAGSVSVTDTLLDLGVYTLLAGVVALTAYSLYVTLDQSNKEYGGWTPKDEFDDGTIKDTSGIRKNARYDPMTEQWTYMSEEEKAAPRVGRSPAPAAADGANRYTKRMEKKRKAAAKAKKRK